MRTLAVFGLMLLATGPVMAQPHTPTAETPAVNAPVAHTPSSKAAKPALAEDRVNQRISEMHQRLKITSEQQPAWDGFAQVMRDNMKSAEQAYKERRASIATMSAPDNMRNFAQIEQGRTDNIQKLAASFQSLYEGMSDDQKKIADSMFRQYGNRSAAHMKAPT